MRSNRDDGFFEARQDWSRRKHLILEYYLKPATAMLGRASSDRRVVILDGFAGPGRYKGGLPGSPILLGGLADIVRGWKEPVTLRIHNVEPDDKRFADLAVATDQWVRDGVVTNHHNTLSGCLQTVLRDAGKSPLVAFLDPFRPKHLPFEDMEPLIARTEKTELLIVLHTRNLVRVLDQVRPSSKADTQMRSSSTQTLNAIFGTDSWQACLGETPTTADTVRFFVSRLESRWHAEDSGLFICSSAINREYDSDLKYHIVFATRHKNGIRIMNDAFAKQKRDIYQQAVAAGLPFALFAENADPQDPTHKPAKVRAAILDAAAANPHREWPCGLLISNAMRSNFGEYSEPEYKRAVRSLLDEQVGTHLSANRGDRLKDGKWKVDNNLSLKMEVTAG